MTAIQYTERYTYIYISLGLRNVNRKCEDENMASTLSDTY